MSSEPVKDTLHHYWRRSHDAVLWKLDGVSDYDARRPMTPTGTNLLGLVKHLASVEIGYFGDTFGRPFPEPLPWLAVLDDDPNADLWVPAEETRDYIVDLYRRTGDHVDATVAELPGDAVGRVAWWPPERAEVTLLRVMVHMVDETAHHAGHADIVRELIDGAVGVRADNTNMPDGDADFWAAHVARVEEAARGAAADGSAPAG